jgi:hypothetical protein
MMSKLLRIQLAFCALSLAATLAAAQGGRTTSENTEPASQTGTNTQARTSADETFELNIGERRITRREFTASTSVEAGEERAKGLSLRVGVELGASSIDVLLRNVRGQVRFRASLERVLDRINSRRSDNTPP